MSHKCHTNHSLLPDFLIQMTFNCKSFFFFCFHSASHPFIKTVILWNLVEIRETIWHSDRLLFFDWVLKTLLLFFIKENTLCGYGLCVCVWSPGHVANKQEGWEVGGEINSFSKHIAWHNLVRPGQGYSRMLRKGGWECAEKNTLNGFEYLKQKKRESIFSTSDK